MYSSLYQAETSSTISLLKTSVELITCPFTLFSPTSKQPSVSEAEFPTWIKTPLNPLTLERRGSFPPHGVAQLLFLNLGLTMPI